MTWNIVLLIIAYIIVGAILTGLMVRWDLIDDYESDIIIGVLFWPILFPLVLIGALVKAIIDWIDYL
jgi:hypothetical protein